MIHKICMLLACASVLNTYYPWLTYKACGFRGYFEPNGRVFSALFIASLTTGYGDDVSRINTFTVYDSMVIMNHSIH